LPRDIGLGLNVSGGTRLGQRGKRRFWGSAGAVAGAEVPMPNVGPSIRKRKV
jgi:hypothetical protein